MYQEKQSDNQHPCKKIHPHKTKVISFLNYKGAKTVGKNVGFFNQLKTT